MSAGYMRKCTGKRRHETKDAANAVRKMMVADGRLRLDTSRALRCDQCGGWHVGGSGKLRGGRGRDGRR